MNNKFKVLFCNLVFLALLLLSHILPSRVDTQQAPPPGTVVVPGSPDQRSNSDSLQLQTFPFATLTPTPAGISQNATGDTIEDGPLGGGNSPGGDVVTAGGVSGNVLSGKVPLYHQWDPRWRNKSFGCGTTMAAAACGPTVLAMIVSYFTNKSILPPEIADTVLARKLRVCNAGTSHSAITIIPPLYGLKSKTITWQQAKVYLSQGIPVIQVHGPGFFTSGGHFIVLTKNSPVGSQNYLVNDPDGRHRTSATEKQITSSLKQSWVISK